MSNRSTLVYNDQTVLDLEDAAQATVCDRQGRVCVMSSPEKENSSPSMMTTETQALNISSRSSDDSDNASIGKIRQATYLYCLCAALNSVNF
jgi:uncharacterized cysteine cluster protein YcgN (CxxCxxCC family)